MTRWVGWVMGLRNLRSLRDIFLRAKFLRCNYEAKFSKSSVPMCVRDASLRHGVRLLRPESHCSSAPAEVQTVGVNYVCA